MREVPAVAAVIAGRPVNLFLDIPPEAEVRQVLDELLALAAQNGVTGTVPVDPDATGRMPRQTPTARRRCRRARGPVEEPLPPHHQEAYDAIAAGDYADAVAEYKIAIAQNPRDALAVAGLAQVSLLQRSTAQTRARSGPLPPQRRPTSTPQLAVADLDVSGGHLDDAFARLLDLFPSLDQTARTPCAPACSSTSRSPAPKTRGCWPRGAR